MSQRPVEKAGRRRRWRASWLLVGLWGMARVFAADATPVAWVPDADGAWTAAANWSSSPLLPGANDDVTISLAGDRLITLSGSSQSIRSLISDERVTISGAVGLTLGATGQF